MSNYCTSCGKPIQANDRFCVGCGAPVGAPVAVPPQVQAPSAPPPASGERLVGVMTGLWRGFTGGDAFNVVVTDRRLIFSRFNAQAATDAAMKSRAAAKAQGGGFLRQAIESSQAYLNPAERYAAMHPDQILAESNGNFAIPLAEVSRIKIRTMMSMIQIGLISKIPKIRIVWPGGNIVYKFESSIQARDGCKLLKGVLGDKVKTTVLWV